MNKLMPDTMQRLIQESANTRRAQYAAQFR